MNSAYKIFSLLIILLVFMPAAGIGQETTQFDQLKQRFENDFVFKSDFRHVFNDTFTGDQQITTGTIWVGKDRYKMRSGESLMFVDGEISRVFDSNKNRVIISDYVEEEDDFAPSRMLQGVDDSYSVEESQTQNGQTVIKLTSEDPFSVFLNVSIFLDSSGIPIQIIAIDQVENELITHFEKGEFIRRSPDLFQFQYPEDAELIDLRHGS